MKKLLALIAAVTMATAGSYVGVYVYRWEWNRAQFMYMTFAVAEIALAAGLILRRLGRLEVRLAERSQRDVDPLVLARIREAAPVRRHFAWLDPRATDRLNVFITLLVGGGVLVSGLAWVVDKVASKTATAALETGLSRRLAAVGFPSGGLIGDDTELLAQAAPFCTDEELRLLVGRSWSAG